MVWSLLPVDPSSGEDTYYIFATGTYKIGRKGCDIIINKDKGVSRVHAMIVVDAMSTSSHLQRDSSEISSKVRVKDCSKYGTFINKDLVSKEKLYEKSKKETILKDGDLISFGTGNATYRFSFVPLVFFLCCSRPLQVSYPFEEKVHSIGAHITHSMSSECTHVLVDESTPLKDVFDAVVAKKILVLYSWVEFVAETRISTEIPSCSLHAPTLTLQGISVKVADPKTREKCLEGYTFLMGSLQMYKFGDRLWSLLEVSGAKILPVEECLSGQDVENGGNGRVVCVIPVGSAQKHNCFDRLNSLSKANEMDLIYSILSGHLNPSALISSAVLVSSSTSTDETIVADSDVEQDTASMIPSVDAAETGRDAKEVDIHVSRTVKKSENEIKVDISADYCSIGSGNSHVMSSIQTNDVMPATIKKTEDYDSANPDIIYSQDLIVRDTNLTAPASSTARNGVVNFKRFRKAHTESGNSFHNLIPFAKYPYKDSDYGSEQVEEVLKEEKRRKQMEALAEDLFNNMKGRRRGEAGSLSGLLSRA